MRGSLTPAEHTIAGTIGSKRQLTGDLSKSNVVLDYNRLINKPEIEGVTLIGNKTFSDLGLNGLTNFEIENICK